MDVYEFDKCLLERLEESMNVLSWKDQVIPASQVRTEWSYFIELQIEPAGWQALWKIPRVICEELNLRFPTMVFGYVEQVLFKELKAVFLVEAVQDQDVHLPERHEVALEDLWPTHSQENTAMDVDRTAECLDRLRFFYTNVWMPWDNDNDDDLNWVEKHLESRIRFCYDLRKRSMKRALAAHIRTLLIEAKYIQQRREYLELGLSDDEELDDTLDKSQITDLMRLHLRLAMIRSEVEMLENPEMRRIYEEIKFDDEKHLKDTGNSKQMEGRAQERVCYVVNLPQKFELQMNLLRMAQQRILKNSLVQMCPSLQEVLAVCNASDHIFLSPGRHSIKFLEYLNDNGIISGLIESKSTLKSSEPIPTNDVVIMSNDDDSILLVFDGDFTLEHLVLDCKNIRSGILVKNGKVCLRNCRLIGDGKSSTQQGIVCSGNAELTLEGCTIEHFATAIILNEGTSLAMESTNILDCPIGMDINANKTKVNFHKSSISGSNKCGIYIDSMMLEGMDQKFLIQKQLSDLLQYNCKSSLLTGECIFKDCKENICIVNQAKSLISNETKNRIYGDNETGDSREFKSPTSSGI